MTSIARLTDTTGPMPQSRFEQLVTQALAQDFSGWDFSWLDDGRWFEADPAWDYGQIVQDKLAHIDSLLDMGTGGGEFLSSLSDLPLVTYATEGYPPNVAVARARLEPLGVKVVAVDDHRALPLADESIELVINRHEYFWGPEVHRILKRGGIFLTQQVGPLECIALNEFLGAPVEPDAYEWELADEVDEIRRAGFEIVRSEEALLDSIFYDIGAVVFFLRVIEWQIPGFSVPRYRERLYAMHELIEAEGAFHAKAHRYLVEAKKLPG